jgi:hypothetical protein
MSKFSPAEAVFAGFRFARERPASLLIWSAYYLLVLAVSLFALFDLAGDKMLQLMALQKAGATDPGPMLAIVDDIAPALGFAALLMIVFGAVMRAAVLRAYLEPGTQPWAGLRFGGDELRVLGAYAFLMLALFCGTMSVSLFAGLAAGINQGLAMIVLIAGLVLMAGVAVRLSLTPVAAFVEKQISLRRSWQLTEGSFWSLVGAYILLFAVAGVILVVMLVLFGALMGVAALTTGGGLADVGLAMRRQYDNLNPILIGLDVMLNVVQVWLSVVFLVVGLGIAVNAYRALSIGKGLRV